MSTPSVDITELDGALGTLPAGTKALAVVGPASSGVTNTPAAFGRTVDLDASFATGANDGGGPALEAAATAIAVTGKPVIFVRTIPTTLGSTSAITSVATGTSVVTVDGSLNKPDDDYDFYLLVVTGGTVGTPGIVIRWSLDDGRTLSPNVELLSLNNFTFPHSGQVKFLFAAGTMVAGDVHRARGTAPKWSTTDLGTALTALRNSTLAWDLCHIVGPVVGTDFDAIVTSFASMKDKAWIANSRLPNLAESDATYQTSLATDLGSRASTIPSMCAGSCELVSPRNGRIYRRPVSFPYAARIYSVREHIDVAAINLGALPGVSIRDANGNPKHHDEAINPGLDDARFTSLRTWDEIAGVYVNNPRIFSPAGSDFQFFQHRRVMNRAKAALRAYFIRRLSLPMLVDLATGFMLTSERLEMEAGADATIRAAIMADPMASGGGFAKGRFVSISATDNLLSTQTITGQGRIVPLAYPKFIDFDIGFHNPSMNLVAV